MTVEHRFGPYGGQYVPETLMPALAELEQAWEDARADPGFRACTTRGSSPGSRSSSSSARRVSAPRRPC